MTNQSVEIRMKIFPIDKIFTCKKRKDLVKTGSNGMELVIPKF